MTTPPLNKPVETVSERYLRHIRNAVVTALVIWLVGGAIVGIVYVAAAAHANSVQQQAACNNNNGIWVNGQCL